MTARSIIECDRCGIEMREKPRVINGMDFCDKCSGDFELFMEPHRTPRRVKLLKATGKKRVAKPCPHHVPCAEPWGCSGDEIVPLSDPRQSLDELGY